MQTNGVRKIGIRTIVLGTVSGGALLLAGNASAQQAGGSDVEQVVVTGSRIGTPGFTTPTPVTEISPLQLQVKEVQTVVDLMNDVPSLTPNQNQTSVADVGVSNLNLRDLGATRTLVMINGLRTEFTSVNGGYDINVIPASLIANVDIVTGGASAAYGSDAVAGVVNITLNTRLTGFRGKVSYGMSDYGDDAKYTASAAWGGDFAGGRGHIVIGGEYYNQLGVLQQGARPWGRTGAALDTIPSCTTISTTCTQVYRILGMTSSTMTDGGLITAAKTSTGAASSALTNIQFGPGGVPQPFFLGALAGGSYMVGGSGSTAQPTMSLDDRIKRDNFLTHVTYDISDDVNVWTEFLYSKSSQFSPSRMNNNSNNITMTAQNPFIPAAIQSIITANKITTFTFSRTNRDLAPYDDGHDLTLGRNETYDASMGLKGKVDAFGSTWSWDVGAQYDTHFFLSSSSQNQITQNFANSVDSLANPATGGVAGVPAGVAVCRSTLTNPTNGCVPVNLFGLGSVSSAATAYFMGTQFVNAELDMFDVAANLKGEPFSTWAGPVSVAAGGEFRRQTTSSAADPISSLSGFSNNNQIPYKGKYSVEEGYLEFGVPLLKNSPLGTALDLDAAVRATSYSTSGGVTTWKVGINYSPIDDVRLRATRSHDIRAPGLAELFQQGTLRNGGTVVINPATNTQSVVSTITTGNPNLVPEIGDTITGGVVYSPSWLDGFNISLDYWNIKMTNVLSQFTQQQTINNCFAGLTQFCSGLIYDPGTGQLATIKTQAFNASLQKTDGFDFEMGYNFEAADLIPNAGGSVQLHVLGTYVNHLTSTGSANYPVDQAGCVGGCSNPRLRYNINAIYINDPWTVSLTGNWIGGGVYNELYNPQYTSLPTAIVNLIGAKTVNDNRVNGRFYVNASVAYQLSDAWGVFARVNNLLNSGPPLLPTDVTPFPHISNGSVYDHVGGQWQVGVRLRLD